MSLLGTSEDGIIFGIRANRAQLQEDLRGMVADVQKATAEVAAAFEKLNSMTPAGGNGGRNVIADGFKDATEQAKQLTGTVVELKGSAQNFQQILVDVGQQEPFEKATESADKFTKGLRALTVTMLAFRAAEAASEFGADLATGIRQGKPGQGFQRGLAGAIQAIPLVGGSAFNTGQNIREVITGERAAADEQTQNTLADARRADIHTKEMVRKAEEKKATEDAQQKAADNDENFRNKQADALRKYWDAYNKGQAQASEKQREANAELNELQLRNLGLVDDAEKADLEEKIRLQIEAAKQYGDAAVDTAKAIGVAERDELAKTQADRQQKREQDEQKEQERQQRDADRAAAQIQREAERQQREADRAAEVAQQRQRRIEDLNASAEEKGLRRRGHGAEAEAREIMRAASRAIADAKGDQSMIDAIVANASEDVRGIRPNGRQTGDVVAASSAWMLNLLGGDGQDQQLLNVQNAALNVLKSMDRKLPIAATTSP